MPEIPNGPLISGSGKFQTVDTTTLSISGGIVGPIGFFGNDPVEQQDGPSTRNDGGEVTDDLDREMSLSLMNTLHSYGLLNNAPIFTGRTITFTNNTTNSPTLELYVTVGGKGNTLTKLHTFAGTGAANAYTYTIPDEYGWSGNFQTWPVGELPVNQLGANLFEISANDQTYTKTATGKVANPLRDNWDISTVPPNVPDPQLDCGPRDQAVAASYTKITNPGSGYFSGFNLATVNNGSGLVDGGTVTSPGTNYPTGATGVSGGSGTGLLIFVESTTTGPPGPVSTISILQPGRGYKDGEVVTLKGGDDNATVTLSVSTGSTGTGLRVDLVSVNGGSITYPICSTHWTPSTPGIGGYTIRDFGSDYSEDDRLTIVQNTAVEEVSAGSGYSVASGVATTSSGAGTGLTVDILEVNGGAITRLGIASDGDDAYAVDDTITVSGGGADAVYRIVAFTPTADRPRGNGEITIGDLTVDQCRAYNVGYQVTPPAPPSDTTTYPPLADPPFWPPVVTTCATLDGNCPQAITWPNDTVLPKSQTGYAQGNYEVSIIDPTLVVII